MSNSKSKSKALRQTTMWLPAVLGLLIMQWHDRSHTLPIWALGLVLVLLVPGVHELFGKLALMQSMPKDFDFVPAHPQDFPLLDGARFNAWTDAFQSLGFVWLQDYRAEAKHGMQITGIARLFAHPTHGCFAEINQIDSPKPEFAGVAFGISSQLEEGWSISTNTRTLTGANYVMRRPKGVWSAYPGAEPAEILAAHLAKREAMIRDLGAKPLPDLSAEAYFAIVKRRSAETRACVRRKSMMAILIENSRFRTHPVHEWNGLYARMAKSRPGLPTGGARP